MTKSLQHLAATGMSDCNGVDTPLTNTPSENDFDGDLFTETWQYNSIIGMLMYLTANTRPDIAYAIHQAARLSHAPRHSHAIAVRRFLRYLQKTKTMGLLLKPTNTQRVDCYHVDADFAGLFAVENNQDPISVKSRPGYVVLYKESPLLRVSKMQTQIALSTMEAEYVALSQAMRNLIPIREILKEFMPVVFETQPSIAYHAYSKSFTDVAESTGPYHAIDQSILYEDSHDCLKSILYEDNHDCLKFARMAQLSPLTKQTHWHSISLVSHENCQPSYPYQTY